MIPKWQIALRIRILKFMEMEYAYANSLARYGRRFPEALHVRARAS
jgi:hypothetical protein